MYAPLLKSFYALGFHLGHSHDKWKPSVLNYILGFRCRLTLHSIDKVVLLFRLAFLFAKTISYLRLPSFFFISKKKLDSFFYLIRTSSLLYSFLWTIPGILTNFKVASRTLGLQYKNILFPSLLINIVVNPSLGFVREANYLGIPLIAIVDSSVSYLEEISYPILASSICGPAFLVSTFRFLFGFSSSIVLKKHGLGSKMKTRLFFPKLRGSIRKLRVAL